ncbi:hypothetical protein D3C71_1993630 [compost metagenome]
MDDGSDLARCNGRAAPRAITRVVGEVDGVHRPHLVTEPLQGEDGGRIANVSVGDVGLDGEDVHGAFAVIIKAQG